MARSSALIWSWSRQKPGPRATQKGNSLGIKGVSVMPIFKHMDPATDHPLEPSMLRHFAMEKDASGTVWSWIVGIIAVIVVMMLVHGYTNKIRATAATSPASNP